MMTPVPTITLNDGKAIPQLGFGVFQIDPADTAEAVGVALDAGYRHIDTAQMYGNEEGVGQGIARSSIPREELYITTKLNNNQHRPDDVRRSFEESLDKLGLDHVDLFLVHWPLPTRYDGDFVSTWKAMAELTADGRARSVGVSNFQPAHLERLVAETGVTPAVNQVELHPRFQQAGLRREHDELGIVTEAWSPLAQGQVLDDPAVVAIAEAHGKTPGQVVIRWHLQIGNVAIPKSVTPGRIQENFEVFDFTLDEDQMAAIEDLDAGARIGPDPDTFVRP